MAAFAGILGDGFTELSWNYVEDVAREDETSTEDLWEETLSVVSGCELAS